MDLISLYGFVVSNVKSHSLGGCRKMEFRSTVTKSSAPQEGVGLTSCVSQRRRTLVLLWASPSFLLISFCPREGGWRGVRFRAQP